MKFHLKLFIDFLFLISYWTMFNQKSSDDDIWEVCWLLVHNVQRGQEWHFPRGLSGPRGHSSLHCVRVGWNINTALILQEPTIIHLCCTFHCMHFNIWSKSLQESFSTKVCESMKKNRKAFFSSELPYQCVGKSLCKTWREITGITEKGVKVWTSDHSKICLWITGDHRPTLNDTGPIKVIN